MNLSDIEAIKRAEFDAWFTTFHLRQMVPRVVARVIWDAAMERAGSRPMVMDATAQKALATIEQRQHERRLRELADAAPEVNRRKGWLQP